MHNVYTYNMITQSADFGIFKELRQSFVINPDLLCNTTEYCLDKVMSGSYVYVDVSVKCKNQNL